MQTKKITVSDPEGIIIKFLKDQIELKKQRRIEIRKFMKKGEEDLI